MVARLKLKGIDGRAHQEWSLRLNLTQHGETYQGQIVGGLTDWELFLDLLGGGAWSFLVRGVSCLVNSDNERDLNLLNRLLKGSSFRFFCFFLRGNSWKGKENVGTLLYLEKSEGIRPGAFFSLIS